MLNKFNYNFSTSAFVSGRRPTDFVDTRALR